MFFSKCTDRIEYAQAMSSHNKNDNNSNNLVVCEQYSSALNKGDIVLWCHQQNALHFHFLQHFENCTHIYKGKHLSSTYYINGYTHIKMKLLTYCWICGFSNRYIRSNQQIWANDIDASFKIMNIFLGNVSI